MGTSDGLGSPSLFGLFRPRLLLPEGMAETFSHERLRHIFLHELAHLKRRDIPVGLLATVLQIVHWFNPLVWLAFYRMRADREVACDALALSRLRGIRPRQYAETIINLLETYSPPTPAPAIVGALASRSQLVRRIVMITQFKSSSHRWTVLGIVLMGVLACVALTNAQAGPAAEDTQDVNAVIGRLDIPTAKLADVIAVFGKPEKYWWEDRTFDKNDLPERYFASYPNGISVFMSGGRIEGIRFEKPGYALHGSIKVGSRMSEALGVLGPAEKTVRGMDHGWRDGAQHVDGYYYTGRKTPFRLIVSKNKIVAIDLLGANAPGGMEKAVLGPDSQINENGRIVDKIDYPFVNDPQVIGQWETVDFLRNIEDFDPKVRHWKGEFLKGMVFQEDGNMLGFSTWTKGLVLHHGDRTASKYRIKDIDGATYMFFEWKSGDYTIRHRKPFYGSS